VPAATLKPSDNMALANCLASSSVGNPLLFLADGVRDDLKAARTRLFNSSPMIVVRPPSMRLLSCANEGHEVDASEAGCIIAQVMGSGTAIWYMVLSPLNFSFPQFAGSNEERHFIGGFNQVDLPVGMICVF